MGSLEDAGTQIRALEPVFHHAQTGAQREVFEAVASPEFWEVERVDACTVASSSSKLSSSATPSRTTTTLSSRISPFEHWRRTCTWLPTYTVTTDGTPDR